MNVLRNVDSFVNKVRQGPIHFINAVVSRFRESVGGSSISGMTDFNQIDVVTYCR
jgi:hypothetical protein